MYQSPLMASIIKILRVLADPNRLCILLLLAAEELSVAELQEILTMGQSTISTHLSQLKQAGLVEDRRTGKSSLYRLANEAGAPGPSHLGTWESSNLDPGLQVLKGHDFSRATNGPKTTGPLGPEGSS